MRRHRFITWRRRCIIIIITAAVTVVGTIIIEAPFTGIKLSARGRDSGNVLKWETQSRNFGSGFFVQQRTHTAELMADIRAQGL